MSNLGHAEIAEIAKAQVPRAALEGTVDEEKLGEGHVHVTSYSDDDDSTQVGDITEEELKTLRRVSGKIPWPAFTIAFIELCERFSYYGTTIVFVNFIQKPLPDGSRTGAGFEGQSGALGMGQRASTGLVTFNQFWSYLMPLVGAWIADGYLGRFNAILVAIAVATMGHVILTASAAPAVIARPNVAIGVFALGMVVMGIGTGFFKSNISPLLAEQVVDTKMRTKVTKSGEKVLVDPAVTNSRLFLYFYMCINLGSLVGQIAMVFAEKYVGFWLSYMLPTVLFLVCPVVLMTCKKGYRLTPPTGSVLAKFTQMFSHATKGKWSLNFAKMKREFTWDAVRPSLVPVEQRPKWMTYDDQWVDEVRRGLKACKVFLFLPLYWLAYSQMTSNLTSQAATMELHGAPNDLIQNLNPISIVIMIPLMDFLVYPALRKARINFTPIKRMAAGFIFAALAMISACVIQVYIYRMSPCGKYANHCDEVPAPINVWVQTIPFVLIGMSEIFTSITSLEYAFSKAPENMRSLVMSVNLLMNAFASAIGQALVGLSEDPLLVWNYAVVSILAAIGGILFWVCFRKLDRDEDKWNMIETSAYRGKHAPNVAPPATEMDKQTSETHRI